MMNPRPLRRWEGTAAAGIIISRPNRRNRTRRNEDRLVRKEEEEGDDEGSRTWTRMGTRSRRRGTIVGFKRRRRDDRGVCLTMMRMMMSSLDRGAFSLSCTSLPPLEPVLQERRALTPHTNPYEFLNKTAAHRQSPSCRSSPTCLRKPVHPSCLGNPKPSDSPPSRTSRTCSVRRMRGQPQRWEE